MSGILKNEYSPDFVGLLGAGLLVAPFGGLLVAPFGGLLVAPFGGLSVAKDYKK
jgi:hypothetical protein